MALVSLHTSPLAQPGTGDAGGMNVYVAQTARRLAARGIEVEIFTRATSSLQLPQDPAWPGVTVRHVVAGPFEGLDKNDLPGQLCSFAAGVMRAEARQDPGYYDLVHSHYWLSGQVGFLVRDRWAVPLVHSAHTLAKVKNAALAEGDSPEPRGRLIGEDQVVAEADRLIANTELEARQLTELYDAEPSRVDVVAPGVDTDIYQPGSRAAARRVLGIGVDEVVLAFAGRVQPLKAPDVLVRAAARVHRARPDLPLRILVVGGLSGTGRDMGGLGELAAAEGVGHLLDSREPVAPEMLAEVYRAADLVVVPSYNESFGLVALEAQACGTPVVAAAVGGLSVAVQDDVTGLLVSGHDIDDWAATLGKLIDDPDRRAAMGRAAPAHAAQFSWEVTVDGLLASYTAAMAGQGRR